MKKRINIHRIPSCLTGLVVVFLCISFSNAQTTLNDYLKMAADSNQALKSTYYEYLAALEKVPQVGSLPDPQVSFGYFISPVETRVGAQQARFSIMQMFPWVGTLGARKDVATAMARSRYEQFEAQKDALFFNVRKIWYKLYELNESIALTGENLKILKTYEDLSLQRFETGSGSMADVLRTQLEIEELNKELEFLEDKRNPLLAEFNLLLNRGIAEQVVTPDTLLPQNIEWVDSSIADSIIAFNDKLENIRQRKEAAENAVTLAKKEGLPSFGLDMSYIMVSERPGLDIDDNGKDAIMTMVTVSLPIWRKKYRAKVKEADLTIESLQFLQEDQEQKLISELQEAMVELKDANRRVELYSNQLTKAEQLLFLLVQSYTNAGQEFEEVLRSQRQILKYKLELARAITAQNIAVARIRSLM